MRERRRRRLGRVVDMPSASLHHTSRTSSTRSLTVGLNRNRADEMRQAAFSVISNTIEADGAMFSPATAAAEGAAATRRRRRAD